MAIVTPMINYEISLHSLKDGLVTDFYDNWSIEETCNSITLESSHPIIFDWEEIRFIHTYECKDNEIAYFKVDVNSIDYMPGSYLGHV